jgi:hypothetical protein
MSGAIVHPAFAAEPSGPRHVLDDPSILILTQKSSGLLSPSWRLREMHRSSQ